jgi:mRNA interferase MazF
LVCAVTNTRRGYPFEVPIPDGLDVTGVVLGQHVRSVDWRERGASFIVRAPDELVESVLNRVSTLFV